MIRKPNRSDAKRLGTGVLVAGMAAAGAVALASPASAAGPLNTLTISPTSGTADQNHCAKYVVTGKDSDGNDASNANITVQTTGANDGNGNTTSATCTGPTAPPTNMTGVAQRNRNTMPTTLDDNGTRVFYVGAARTGTVSITVDSGNATAQGSVISNTATLNVVQNANNGVSNLTVSPTSLNVTAGSPARFRVHATDSNGNPIQAVTISRNSASTTQADTIANGAAVTTDVNGNATYTVPGSDTDTGGSQTFYVNQTTGGGNTGGPDAGEPQAQATINVVPAKNVTAVTLTCPEQATADDDDATTCTVPSNGTATLNAKATTGTGANAQPVEGAIVHFTLGATMNGSDNNTGVLSADTATTDAKGIATVTLTAGSPNATNGETDTVTATVNDTNNGTGSVTSNQATVNFVQRDAAALVVSPGDQSVDFGSTITETAKVVDQFGTLYKNQAEAVRFQVSGRNTIDTTLNTNSSGMVTFSYKDNAPASDTSTKTDSLTVTDNPPLPVTDDPNGSTTTGSDGPYTITYVSGGVTPSSVGLNFVAKNTNGTNVGDEPSCVTDTNDPKDKTTTNTTTGATPTEVCAIVRNGTKQPLAGQSVTFTVSKGEVGDNNVISDNDGMTYTVTTNTDGVAVAYVTASTAGAQTITAAVGSVTSNPLTDTYSSNQPVYTVTVSPTTATITAGNTQKFTATATDQSGNGIQGQTLTVTQSGAGVVNNSTVVTGSDGTASVNVTTAKTDSGQGSVTFTDPQTDGNGTQACNPNTQGATCNATATYKVNQTTSGTVSQVTAYVANGAKVGSTTEFASSLATDSAGNPVQGATLNFAITGSNTISGTATTGADGRAKFFFVPQHAGSITATVSYTGVPSANASGTIAKGVATTRLAQVSPQKYRIRDTATISAKVAGVQVDFYQTLASGKNKYVGSSDTDDNGVAVYVHYRIKSGYVYTGIAKVASSNADYTGPNSNVVKTTVK